MSEPLNEIDERWRPVKGYEGFYEVSSLARVRSLPRVSTKGKILKATMFNTGYYYVDLSKNGTRTKKQVHRLVAQSFIPNPDNLPQVNHKDGVKTNLSLDNLEWCTARYNNQHAFRTRLNKGGAWLTDAQLRFVLSMKGQATAENVASKLPVGKHTVYNIWNNKSYIYAKGAL